MEGPLPLSSLRLLVPPLRVMSAVMWKVVCLRNMKHYGRVEEFISMVSEVIPDLLTDGQMRLLTLGLRAKMTLQLLSSDQTEDQTVAKACLSCLLPSSSKQVLQRDEALEQNFVRLVERLVEDPKERGHFLENVFPVEYGPDFDSALENLLCEFLTRLEEMLHIPDFKQTAVWINDEVSVLEECMQCPSREDDLRLLLKSKACCDKKPEIYTNAPSQSEQRLLSSLSLPLSRKETGTRDVESNTQTFENQSPIEVVVVKIGDCGEQDTEWPSEVEECSNADQTTAEKCSEDDEEALPPFQVPSTSSQSPALSGSVINQRPRQRVAHKCAQCGKCFIYRCELVEHQRVHTGENPYKCSQCGKAFRRASDLSAHRRTKCTEAAYICIKCGDSFQTAQDKSKHRCGQKLDCSQCGKRYRNLQLLGKHELTHTQGQTYTCRQCGVVYSSISELRNHQKIHPPQLSNQCGQCGKFFSSATTLAAHEIRHQQKRTEVCPSCGKGFKNKPELKVHMRSHTGERPFECTYCGKRFSMSGNLNIHIRIHTGEKPFLCSNCGKTFISAGELQIHRRTHTGEKPYKCTVCGRAFIKTSKLTLHMRVHTGERPYVCSECGKGFSSGVELKNHNMTHTGVRPYACHLCAKTYTCTSHLKTHLKTHSVV
ncbi:zinc finger protein ZFMSA12A-like isoform X2 [Cheilinus undulatus]|uniref:zinc finger protein ZFMSA12A-like isoform X2 n=1 Tax=Cheilinus undulatus TaxID=241271 RepID=UPI001BD4E563|nr:zinc finger protein ZFMSA12A-like isoform X2 [Cheilinus undulatus]